MGKTKINPRKNANILSVLIFAYILPTFVKGYRKNIDEDDIPEHLDEHSSSKLGNRLEKEWEKELTCKSPSLWKAILRAFGLELIILGIPYAINQLIIRILQPLALFQLMKYYSQSDNNISEQEAIFYAGMIVAAAFVNTFLVHNNMLSLQHLGMKLRVACCSLIYRKSLRLSKSALGGTAVGQTINLLSNDVNRCDRAALHAHTIWVSPLQTVIIIIILYNLLGLTSTVGIFLMAFFVPLQVYLATKTSEYRMKTALKTDERIRLMSEIISGIQVIKTYTWEKPFAKLIKIIRRQEIVNVRVMANIKAILSSILLFITRISIFLTILTYLLTGNLLQADYVFVVTAFYNIIKQIMAKNFLSGVNELAEFNVSIFRFKEFLLHEEAFQDRTVRVPVLSAPCKMDNEEKCKSGKCFTAEKSVELKNLSAKWNLNSLCDTLHDITFKAKQGECVALIGPVGSGKTSILNVILKEFSFWTGELSVTGKLSYAAQDPWIFSGSVQENILFGQKMDRKRYEDVLRVCALQQDLTFLPYGDRTLVGERGTMLSGGQRARINLARAVYKEADIYLLDDPLSAVDSQVGKQIFEECILNFLKNRCTILVTHQLQYLQNVKNIFFIENGEVCASGTYDVLKSSQINFVKQLDEDTGSEIDQNIDTQENSPNNCKTNEEGEPRESKEHRSYGTIAGDVYLFYMKAGGSLAIAILILFVFITIQLSLSAADYFLTFWVNLEQENLEMNATYISTKEFSELTRETCTYIYSGIVAFMSILTLIGAFTLYKYCMRASIKLHDNMLLNIIYSPIKFFNTNSSGRILNRFSRDMGAVDEALPTIALNSIEIALNIIGITVVVSLVKPWLLIVSVIIFVVFYIFRVIYLATSRNVKRLDGITRSPVFEQITMSLQGLSTIRAYEAQNYLEKRFDDLQDTHSSVWYMYITCSKAFSFWLDIICLVYLATVTFSFFISKSEECGGDVGLAITQALNLTDRFQWGMRQWSDLENQMTSVERIMEYTKLKREENQQEIDPPQTWPEEGGIRFESVSLRYSSKNPRVLKKLSFSIKPQEKIGIVGRTGAGKSSLIYALFQLVKTEGEIFIDNIDISKISFPILRSKISIIPQEPLLFYGTLRKNLDPFEQYSDLDLWSALNEVELKHAVENLPLGLNASLSEGGSNFSVGQRQLVCLARALIRKNKILILDEATANVDLQTDKLIQDTIRRKFTECTVLTIAHRLRTIMDSDKVLVMNLGSAVEFEHPYLLLNNKNSTFYEMVQQAGTTMTEFLYESAKQNYQDNSKNLST